MFIKKKPSAKTFILFALFSLSACTAAKAPTYWHDPSMDFGSIKTVAVMPFVNATREQFAAERVRDAFFNRLLATGGVYALPKGEVARGISRAGITDPTAPSPEEIQKFAGISKVDAVITGTVTEYGEVRSGTSAANVVSVSMQMIEAQTGRVIWAVSSTKGGITVTDRLFGGGGQPMADVIGKAVDDIIEKLFE